MIRPARHEAFWSRVDTELADVPAETHRAAGARPDVGGVAVSRVTFTGLGGVRVAAWLCAPTSPGPHPGLLMLPGYKADPLPGVYWARQGFASLTLAHRGKLGAMSAFDPGYPGVLVEGLDDPGRYAYRGIYADAIRALEVLTTLPGVAEGPCAVFGYSQGGALAVVAAARRPGLVHRVAVGAPFLTALPYSIAASRAYPYREVAEVLMRHPERSDEVFATLAHFDTLGFAPAITAPTLLYRAADDEICPPLSAAMLHERLGAPTQWLEYPEAAHAGTHRRSQPDAAAFLGEGLRLAPPDQPMAAVATMSAAHGRPAGRAPTTDRAQRTAAHRARVHPETIDLTTQHPARATLYWVSVETPDGARAGGYLSVPDDPSSAAAGVVVEFPGYESVVSVPHPEDRERFTILTLAHRGQRGRGFGTPTELPGLLDPPPPGGRWMLEHLVEDCLLGLEVLVDRIDPAGEVIGVGPDWSLLVAASAPVFTHLEVDDYWITAFDPGIEEPAYPRRELSEQAAVASADELDHLSARLTELSPTAHARAVTCPLLLVTGGGPAQAAADSIADAAAGPVERHATHRGSASEAAWRDARRSALLGVRPAQRWRYARAGIPGC